MATLSNQNISIAQIRSKLFNTFWPYNNSSVVYKDRFEIPDPSRSGIFLENFVGLLEGNNLMMVTTGSMRMAMRNLLRTR